MRNNFQLSAVDSQPLHRAPFTRLVNLDQNFPATGRARKNYLVAQHLPLPLQRALDRVMRPICWGPMNSRYDERGTIPNVQPVNASKVPLEQGFQQPPARPACPRRRSPLLLEPLAMGSVWCGQAATCTGNFAWNFACVTHTRTREGGVTQGKGDEGKGRL